MNRGREKMFSEGLRWSNEATTQPLYVFEIEKDDPKK